MSTSTALVAAHPVPAVVEPKRRKTSPTRALADALSQAYTHLNRALWGGRLPPVLVQCKDERWSRNGHYAPGRWDDVSQKREVAEIMLNARHFGSRSTIDILSTLAHEMAHHWQHTFGTPSKNTAYHNVEWGDEMDRIGLTPTNTGLLGGKRTGTQMTHMVIEGGAFWEAAQSLLSGGFALPFTDNWSRSVAKPDAERPPLYVVGGPAEPARPLKHHNKNKTAFECPSCSAKMWGKAELKAACVPCTESAGAMVIFTERS